MERLEVLTVKSRVKMWDLEELKSLQLTIDEEMQKKKDLVYLSFQNLEIGNFVCSLVDMESFHGKTTEILCVNEKGRSLQLRFCVRDQMFLGENRADIFSFDGTSNFLMFIGNLGYNYITKMYRFAKFNGGYDPTPTEREFLNNAVAKIFNEYWMAEKLFAAFGGFKK